MLFARPSIQEAHPASIDSLNAQANLAKRQGQYAEAVRLYGLVAGISEREGRKADAARAVNSLSACQIRLFHYRAAIAAGQHARVLGEQAHDLVQEGGAAINLSAAYSQLGDWDHALAEAEQAVNSLKTGTNHDYLGRALLNEAIDESALGLLDTAQKIYSEAIAEFRKAGNASFEARCWDELGTSMVLANRLEPARNSLQKALALETAHGDDDARALTLEHLAELELRTGNFRAASDHMAKAFSSTSILFRTSAQYYPLHVRGQILEALGRKQEALNEYRKAVTAANEWRRGALPGDMSNTQTVVILHDVYSDFAQLAAELSLANHDPALAQEGFAAIAENRAASLREQITLAYGENLRLPPRYFELLSQLQAVQAQVTLGGRTGNPAELQKIRLELDDLENQIGLGQRNIPRQSERNGHRNSLRTIQGRLADNELLLSFALGNRRSFLWAVTKYQMRVCEIKSANDLRHEAISFAEAARQNAPSLAASGQRLSSSLFAAIPPDMARNRHWLIAGEGPLLESIPFADLPEPHDFSQQLIASHSVRLLPSELLLLVVPRKQPNPVFVGIGDPIYNLADSRRQPKLIPAGTGRNPASLALARLPGSNLEIRSSASASGMIRIHVLAGPNANGANLSSALEDRPEIIHFAVHVVRPDGQPQQAALALSLNADNVPELLTPEVIAQYRVPGSLVVLSGCASEQGQSLPSAGLLGLSRAWLLAGAEAVVATAWPTPDDSGYFFSMFYAHFSAIKTGTLSQRAALALEQSQLDMQRGGGYRASPSFWAAYSIISKE